MGRIDYFNDPNAPSPNSVVPSVTVAVRDDVGRILLIHKIDNGLWALPGGGHDAGERIADTAVREVQEETGLRIAREDGTETKAVRWVAPEELDARRAASSASVAMVLDSIVCRLAWRVPRVVWPPLPYL
jgi:8-oxo-dGTP pyrophosphatase MutT (NUDIX family)